MEEAKKKQSQAGKEKLRQNSSEASEDRRTRKKVTDIAGVSHDTITREKRLTLYCRNYLYSIDNLYCTYQLYSMRCYVPHMPYGIYLPCGAMPDLWHSSTVLIDSAAAAPVNHRWSKYLMRINFCVVLDRQRR